MIRILISLLLLCSTANAKDIDIITRFGNSSVAARNLIEYVYVLNGIQSDYTFKVVSAPGARGEVADLKAKMIAETNDVLIFNSTSSYTNKSSEGIIPLYSIWGSPQFIMVAQDSPIQTIDDFIKFAKAKPNLYYATEDNASGSAILNNQLIKEFGLKNVVNLSYKSTGDAKKSILIGEADYTIFNVNEMIGLKPIKYFDYMTESMMSVPATRLEFGSRLKPIFMAACNDKVYIEKLVKTGYTSVCKEK
jgi:tripartite-type tricarboxylate transporter receptor subunit TctC